MNHQLFLSHDSRDRERAQIIARAISRVTLAQISVWYSSDSSGGGGVRPGNVWLEEIRERLSGSRAVVALLTPTSISRPWLLFESGFGAANPQCDVIPVCVGIDRLADIPFPLAMYQAYQLSDYESLKTFIEKLLTKYQIHFDDQMAKPVLREAIRLLAHRQGDTVTAGDLDEPSLNDAVSDLKSHIDKRIFTLISSGTLASERGPSFSVLIDAKVSKQKLDQFVEIRDETSIQDVLDNVYYMLGNEVDPYTYLEQWLLRELDSGTKLIIREIQSRVPAKFVFTPGSKWEVVLLKRPYSASDDRPNRDSSGASRIGRASTRDDSKDPGE